MMQKRKLNSLLLISFLVVFAFSYASANEVTYETISSFYRCDSEDLTISITTQADVAAIEIVFEVAGDGNADFDALDVNFLGTWTWLSDYRFIEKTSRVHPTGPDSSLCRLGHETVAS